MKRLALAFLLAPLPAAAAPAYATPHLRAAPGDRAAVLGGRRFVDHGLVASGRLPAATVDFLGDTLGSFSSLAIDRASWRRAGDRYEGILWTLPDRGRNDPGAGLFYDYAARLHRFRLRLLPPAAEGAAGTVEIVPDGGLELRDLRGLPFTGADPGAGTLEQAGVCLPSPRSGAGAGKVSIDSESLAFTADGHFYVGDEYSAGVFRFDPDGKLGGVLAPPAAVAPRTDGRPDFGSLKPPASGRRNNQGVEGLALSPDGTRLFVALQSALVQDTAVIGGDGRNAAGRVDARVLVYDVAREPLPRAPAGHYVVQLPAYRDDGRGGAPDRTAAQSEIRALNRHQFLMLARDANGLGADNGKPIVYKSVLLVDIDGASNLAGSVYETTAASVLRAPGGVALKPGIRPARWVELVDLLDREGLARAGLDLDTTPRNRPSTLSEKWEAMDLVPALDPARPHDFFLFVGNDNDFIARRCTMQGQRCDSAFDNDNRLLVYRLTLPTMDAPAPRK